ncbi:uncharacterized protein [Dermacentor andersoni]|uniref:uncharacterized protein n=1 Tax=Dermacentor andersoni TaxID=34620 RepID=UPI002416BCE0|nr:uncharacterized protein LOC129383463 [Dermacentor andersoni]
MLCAGKQMENEARAELSIALGTLIHEVGLFIDPEQPWLCCSPDGILDSDGRMCLVEINCPFSLKDKKLINHEHEESFMPMMIMLYILGMREAFLYYLFITAKHHCMCRCDETFLAEYMPELETFYFKHFLSEIVNHT